MSGAEPPERPAPERIHLIGICGTGMAGLALILKQCGHAVTGSDAGIYPPMQDVLGGAGIAVAAFDAGNVAQPLDAIVLSAGVSRANPEAIAAVAGAAPVLSLPAALQHYVLRHRDAHVVAGTHGKTTTASMLAWIHDVAGARPGFLIGGMPKNFNANGRFPHGRAMIVEGDEYKSSNLDLAPKFLKFSPRIAIITNVEFDHADVYPDLDAVIAAFHGFARRVPDDGALVVWNDQALVSGLRQHAAAQVVTVGRDDAADWRLVDHSGGGPVRFDIRHRDGAGAIGPVVLAVPGRHNAGNAALAAVAAHLAGIDTPGIVRALGSFAGVRRRLDVVATAPGIRIIDDFAHHPTEVAASIAALKEASPGTSVWALFEPRSTTSRRAIFQEVYRRALGTADRVTIAAFPQRTDGGEMLDVQALADGLCHDGVPACVAADVDAIVADVVAGISAGALPPTDLLVMSSGPFGGLVQRLRAALIPDGGGSRTQAR